MDERQTMHAMMLDDAYCVERVLADGAYGVTEMVSLDGVGPFVRKKMPLRLARRRASPFRSSCATRRGTLCSGVVSMCVNRPKANPARSPSRSMVCPSTPPMRRTPMPRRCFSFGRGTFVLLRRAICVRTRGFPFGTSLKTVSILQEVECTSCNEDRCLQRSEYVPCRPVGVPTMGDDVTRRRRLE